MFKRIFLIGLIVLSSTLASAKIFRNAYISFELPDSWKCVLEHTEWVCRSESIKEAKEAIIILTAKETGPTDSFDVYAQRLSKPFVSQSKSGQSAESKITALPKQNLINNHTWVDGLHLHSEIPNYFTRYLATIKEQIAVLITYSAHKDLYTKYSTDFFKSVQSLQVIATKNLLNDPSLGPINKPGSGDIIGGASIGDHMEGMDNSESPSQMNSNKFGNSKNLLLGLAVILMAGAIFIFLKMKKK